MQQQANIDWCLANRELVNRWLEQRGGPQQGDWLWTDDLAYTDTVMNIASWEEPAGVWQEIVNPVWLPNADDVLEMLKTYEGTLQMTIWPDRTIAHKQGAPTYGDTPIIALMELLKQIEEAT